MARLQHVFIVFVGAVVPTIHLLAGFESAVVIGMGTIAAMVAAIGVTPPR